MHISYLLQRFLLAPYVVAIFFAFAIFIGIKIHGAVLLIFVYVYMCIFVLVFEYVGMLLLNCIVVASERGVCPLNGSDVQTIPFTSDLAMWAVKF